MSGFSAGRLVARVPGIAWVGVLVLVFAAAGGYGILARRGGEARLAAAHQATTAAERGTTAADAIVKVDTVERRAVVIRYRDLRDSARHRLTDTALVAWTFTAADSALSRSDSSLDRLARANAAHVIYEGALRTELALSERLRAPRLRLSGSAGADAEPATLVTEAEAELRVKGRWSLVGRVEKRWAPGEPTHRLLFVRYSVGL